MSMHTPGPWFTHREGFSTVYVEARIAGGLIQEVAACGPTNEGSDQQEANATLISAAPDLLDALEQAYGELTRAWDERRLPHDCLSGKAFTLMGNAIAKAKGES